MNDVRIKRGADTALNHHLVITKMKLKLKRHWTTGQTALQKFNTTLLRLTTNLNQFKVALNNTFQAPQDLPKEEGTTR
ncbi:unnamed protein product [Schistosoma margrebowiei]|uniref:Uncharacterized protein n=1 Tax=Schistosoma margrebowiei TaxID=48269 RepID=A0A183N315_9TREM|nr:unnamed protein product [Schistosoma margrebowiei]